MREVAIVTGSRWVAASPGIGWRVVALPTG